MTKVLLVEDDAWLAELESSVLQKAGYEVHTVTNGQMAIDYIDESRPDIIVLDVLLSGMTAFALLNELQSHEDTYSIPVVICTNLAEEFRNSRLIEYGVRRVIDKSVMHPQDIVVAVKAVLG